MQNILTVEGTLSTVTLLLLRNWAGVVVHPFTHAFGKSEQEGHLNLGVVNYPGTLVSFVST